MKEELDYPPMTEVQIMTALIELERLKAGKEKITMAELVKRAEKRAGQYLPGAKDS